MSSHSDTRSNSEHEPSLQEEPAPFSAAVPNQNGGPSSKDPNANALDANAPNSGALGIQSQAPDAEEAPNLLHYPGDNFADGT